MYFAVKFRCNLRVKCNLRGIKFLKSLILSYAKAWWGSSLSKSHIKIANVISALTIFYNIAFTPRHTEIHVLPRTPPRSNRQRPASASHTARRGTVVGLAVFVAVARYHSAA